MSETARPSPTLRKEVVETSQWGELVVCQLMASARMGLTANDEDAATEETEPLRKQRVGRNYAIFLSELMARAVTAKDGVPMYSAADWDAWNVIAGDDCLKLANKALALNGYRTLDGEDVAKNV
jgi:hypothetical protein